MTTVMELLGHPVFANFRLITDHSGLYNKVKNSGIFDWEQGDELKNRFNKGDFIITALSHYDKKEEQAEFFIRRLIDRSPAAIAIKDIYFSTLSNSTIEYADEKHVPIFFFSDTYFDDIVFTIKNSLTPGEINFSAVQKMRKILYENISSFEKELITKEINQYFYDNVACMIFLPRNQEESSNVLTKYEKLYNSLSIKPEDFSSSFFSLIRFPRGVCLIFSASNNNHKLIEGAISLSKQLKLSPDDFSIGVSTIITRLSHIDLAFKEALYASIDSLIEEQSIRHFDEIGLMQIICPLRKDYWFHRYFQERLEKIQSYDIKKSAEIMNTVTTFVRCRCNFAETSKILFSHINTIRYRINKAYEILGIENSMDANAQLSVLVRLQEVNRILSGLRL